MFVYKQFFYKNSKQTQFKWPNLQSFHPPTPKCFSKGTHALKTLPLLCFERVIRWTADPRIKSSLLRARAQIFPVFQHKQWQRSCCEIPPWVTFSHLFVERAFVRSGFLSLKQV